jgi:hypothetical protein
MGTITISIDDETEKKLRKIASMKFGKTKGHLGSAVTEAVEMWSNKVKNCNENKTLELLERGISMGKITWKRDELHER